MSGEMRLFSCCAVLFVIGLVSGLIVGHGDDGAIVMDENGLMVLPGDNQTVYHDPQLAAALTSESVIVEHEPFENIMALPYQDYMSLRWLESRASFNRSGLVVVGYDMFFTSIQGVDRLAGELIECQQRESD